MCEVLRDVMRRRLFAASSVTSAAIGRQHARGEATCGRVADPGHRGPVGHRRLRRVRGGQVRSSGCVRAPP